MAEHTSCADCDAADDALTNLLHHLVTAHGLDLGCVIGTAANVLGSFAAFLGTAGKEEELKAQITADILEGFEQGLIGKAQMDIAEGGLNG
jgi:hypothetical protein